MPLSPFATLLVTQYVTQNRIIASRRSVLAAFTAGLVFAFAPLRLGYGLAFLNLYNTEFIPLYVVFLLRATRGNKWLDRIVAGILLGLNAYIDFQIAACLIVLTIIYAVYHWIDVARRERSLPLVSALKNTAIALVPVAAIAAIVALPILAVMANDFAIEGGNYIGVYKLDYSTARSYDLLSYILPNARSSLYSGVPLKVMNVNAAADPDDETPRSPDRQAFAGYVVLGLALFATCRRWRAARLWVLIAALFALFSFGPWLHVAGQLTTIPLPFIALHEIPIVNNIRVPMRYGIIVDLVFAVLVALAIKQLQVTLTARRFPLLWSGLALLCVPLAILAEYAVLPYPVQAISMSPVYDQIARTPGDFTVLEIPSFNWRWASATELYQAVHEKRILRAYTNRIAPDLAEYFGYRGTPIIMRSLRVLEGVERGPLAPEDVAEDKSARDVVLAFYNLRYAVVHKDMLASNQVAPILSYIQDVLGGQPAYDDGTTIAYTLPRVEPPPTLSIDLRENIGQMYAGRGWHFQYPPANWNSSFNFVWASGARSEIYFPSADPAERDLVLNAFAESPQSVSLVLNGQRVAQFDPGTEWKDYTFRLPANIVQAGMNRLELVYAADQTDIVGVTTIRIQRGQNGSETNR
jgi:hypothetical protein